ncbi:diguanylate cyclase (GGDEF)-like protein [Rhodanobacter sp. MP7CTX1]|nr:diguanylate cyclase (GGDEF)-like protein [Rhodanobacter sp. MP7CTX1]
MEWLGRLIDATTPIQVAAVIVELVEAQPGCIKAMVVWITADGGYTHVVPATAPSSSQLAQAQNSLQIAHGAQPSPAGQQRALCLLKKERVVLLLTLRTGASAQTLFVNIRPCLQLATRHMRHATKLVNLHDSHNQLEHSENLQSALFAISDLAGSELEMSEMLRGIHRIVCTLMYGENFFIVRFDPERGTLRFLYYADIVDKPGPDVTKEEPLENWLHTLTWYLLTGGKPLMGSAEQLHEQVAGPLTSYGPHSNDWLGVPMLRNGQVLGAMVVQSYNAGIVYSGEDRALLEFVGSHILTALERKESKERLEDRVRRRTRELATANRGLQQNVLELQRTERLQAALFQLAQLATADIDQNEFYKQVHAVVGALLNAENFFIALLSADRQTIEFPYFVDCTEGRVEWRPLGRGLTEYVLRRGQSLRVGLEAILELDRQGEIALKVMGLPALCWLGVPLLVGDKVIGLVAVQSYTEAIVYSLADQELLSFAALQIANSIYRRSTASSLHHANLRLEQRVEERTLELRQQIVHRERIQLQLKHQVMHDPLTGLPNRGFLRERIDRVLALIHHEPGRRCALLYLDVDRFKLINDSLGHLAGDVFLQAIATRLQHCVREPDVVARLAGDEFAILLEDIDVPAAATHVAQRVLQTLGMPLHISGKELAPSVSVGIACGDVHYLDADEMLRDADIALYQAKQLGRKRFVVFDETLAKGMVDVLTMEGELRLALQLDQFEPFFQPICRLDGGDVVGYEALIRWNHPRRGLLEPSIFLKIAGDSGLIEAIDWRMFEICCGLLVQHDLNDAFMTFNVSALHLSHADFDTRMVRLLESAGLSPSRLIVEVTEGALLDNPDLVRATLERLRTSGVGAALDDFGTGYSSLNYLHSLPLRMLKIDQAFVQELDKLGNTNSTTVVAAILALARALNIQVIAEGIETKVQRDALLAMGCEMGQGYLLGRPAPIEHWLECDPSSV